MVASTRANLFNLDTTINDLSSTFSLGVGHQEEDPQNDLKDANDENSSSLLLMHDLIPQNTTFDRIATVSDSIAVQPSVITSLFSCRIMIYSKTFDGHYEVFESIARKYPLPFSSTANCQNAGLTPENPIVVDFVMPFQWQGGYKQQNTTNGNGNGTTAKTKMTKKGKKKKGKRKPKSFGVKTTKSSQQSEGWGWTAYYQRHLQNCTARRIVPREHDDDVGGRYINYAGILGVDKQSFQSIQWKSYSFVIEASCDMWGNKFWKDWLTKDKKRHFCVFHRKHEKKKLAKGMEKRTCYLNPQFEQGHHCWFLPTVYPKFPKPAAPFTATNPKLNVCIGWKSMGKGAHNMRDEALLARALWNLSNTWSNVSISNEGVLRDKVQVLVIGRNARVPDSFVQAKIAQMVQVHNNLVAFYEYQQLIATKCHALIPLVHPEQSAYFLTPPNTRQGDADEGSKTKRNGGQGRLSGMIAQVIGNRIPSLVHAAVADVYQREFTAPYFVYNSTKDGGKSFQFALERLVDYYSSNRVLGDENG
ncbi:MAG: hypothetical protein SGBAC_008491 [Bacillariaceae sp.]